MRLKQLTHQGSSFQSFHVRHDTYPKNHNVWHYHEELEFIQVRKGSGTLFIGDCIRKFGPGDVVLIGPNIPHYWFFDPEYLDAIKPIATDNCVIHFQKSFAGEDFFYLPEMTSIKDLLLEANKGLWYRCDSTDPLNKLFEHILIAGGFEQLLILLQALYIFHHKNKIMLVSDNYAILNHSSDHKRMNDIVDYIQTNFRQHIELSDLANLAGMTNNSFCRYFKQKTGKTPLEFTTELRIASACKFLSDTNTPLKEVCFECGYNNYVSFHNAFKRITGLTPKNYKIKAVPK